MYQPSADDMIAARVSPDVAAASDGMSFYRKRGCPRCNQTGYKGRVGIFQLMEMNEDLATMAAKHASREEIERAALAGGTKHALGRRHRQGRGRPHVARRARPRHRLAACSDSPAAGPAIRVACPLAEASLSLRSSPRSCSRRAQPRTAGRSSRSRGSIRSAPPSAIPATTWMPRVSSPRFTSASTSSLPTGRRCTRWSPASSFAAMRARSRSAGPRDAGSATGTSVLSFAAGRTSACTS